MAIVMIGADISPMVIRVRPITGNGTWNETGCITKIVERKKSIRVTIENLSMSDMTVFWNVVYGMLRDV